MSDQKAHTVRVIVISESAGVENQRIEFSEGANTAEELIYKHLDIAAHIVTALTQSMTTMAVDAQEALAKAGGDPKKAVAAWNRKKK